jgi:hypothetical protein
MPHPLTLSYETRGEHRPLRQVDAGGERTVTLPGLQGDSVTLFAASDFMPDVISQTFPARSTVTLTWVLGF